MFVDHAPPQHPVIKALSDATGRWMMRRLRAGPSSLGEPAAPFQISLTASSRRIKALERAGLMHRTVQGRTRQYYRQFWTRRVDGLGDPRTALRCENLDFCKGKHP